MKRIVEFNDDHKREEETNKSPNNSDYGGHSREIDK